MDSLSVSLNMIYLFETPRIIIHSKARKNMIHMIAVSYCMFILDMINADIMYTWNWSLCAYIQWWDINGMMTFYIYLCMHTSRQNILSHIKHLSLIYNTSQKVCLGFVFSYGQVLSDLTHILEGYSTGDHTSPQEPIHWNVNVIILMRFSSLAILEVVILTTSNAANDENFLKMKHKHIFLDVLYMKRKMSDLNSNMLMR